LGAWLLRKSDDPWRYLLTVSVLVMLGGALHILIYRLQFVTDYPFTLYWSEGNRFFDYSTLFGSFRYITQNGRKIFAFITRGMQLPWALPFVLPNLSIGAFRFWYQMMWVIPAMILGTVEGFRVKTNLNRPIFILVFSVWTFMFLDQGPIYTPLVLAAILTAVAVRSKVIPGILLVIAASYYAVISRWTWSYAPGLWAGLVALLAGKHPDFSKEGIRRLVKPVCLGIAGYFGGQILPGIIRLFRSHAPGIALFPDVVETTTRQPLLWQRLLPNPTFAPGIVLALLWAILPLVVFIVFLIKDKLWRLNWLQKSGLAAINVIFLVVGIIASVKIGGGSNLHNLDMFLVGLVLIASQAVVAVSNQDSAWLTKPAIAVLVSLILVAPTTFALSGGERLLLPEENITHEALTTVQGYIKKFSQKGEILFIDHRQLLTFGLVENVPLIDEYEKKVLMDDAMTSDAEYFKKFHDDLNYRRFSMIVNEPATIVFRGSEHIFGEENDAYVSWVTIPLLCTYEPIYTARDVNLELLVPRKELADDIACIKYGFSK